MRRSKSPLWRGVKDFEKNRFKVFSSTWEKIRIRLNPFYYRVRCRPMSAPNGTDHSSLRASLSWFRFALEIRDFTALVLSPMPMIDLPLGRGVIDLQKRSGKDFLHVYETWSESKNTWRLMRWLLCSQQSALRFACDLSCAHLHFVLFVYKSPIWCEGASSHYDKAWRIFRKKRIQNF